jgi:hypothetical protein
MIHLKPYSALLLRCWIRWCPTHFCYDFQSNQYKVSPNNWIMIVSKFSHSLEECLRHWFHVGAIIAPAPTFHQGSDPSFLLALSFVKYLFYLNLLGCSLSVIKYYGNSNKNTYIWPNGLSLIGLNDKKTREFKIEYKAEWLFWGVYLLVTQLDQYI